MCSGSNLGAGDRPHAGRYVTEARARSKRLMLEREADIDAGIEHLTPAEAAKRRRIT